MSIHLQQKEV